MGEKVLMIVAVAFRRSLAISVIILYVFIAFVPIDFSLLGNYDVDMHLPNSSQCVLVLPARRKISPPRRIQTKFELLGRIDESLDARSIRFAVFGRIDTTITAMIGIVFGGIATSY